MVEKLTAHVLDIAFYSHAVICRINEVKGYRYDGLDSDYDHDHVGEVVVGYQSPQHKEVNDEDNID